MAKGEGSVDESSCAGLSVASSPGAQPPPCPEPEVNEHLPGSSSVDPACVRYVPPGSRGASPPPGIAYRSYPPGMPYAYGPPGRVTYVFGSFGAEQMAQGPWMQAQPPPGAAYPGPPPAPGLGCGSPPRFGGASPPPHAELHYPIPGSPPGYYMIPGPGYRSGGASPTYLGAYPFSGMAAPRGGSDDGIPGGSPTGSVDYTTTAFAGLGLERRSSSRDGLSRTSSSSSLRRASARIARSTRAGGAYNAEEYVFDPERVAEPRSGRVWTTVMIRNIPNKYTQSYLLRHLELGGCKGMFDFLYLPVDFRNSCNLGYSFVNFLSTEAMLAFYEAYHGKTWRGEESSTKVCEVTYGRVQGFDALVQHFKGAKFPTKDPAALPVVFAQVEDGMASRPVTLHKYVELQVSSEGKVDTAQQDEVEGPASSD